MAFCPECGAEISAEAVSCPKCGRPMKTESMGGRSRITAALLAFFMGGFGIHKFYLGEGGKGVLFLLFCWTAIPSICGFIDFIIIIGMSDEKFNKTY